MPVVLSAKTITVSAGAHCAVIPADQPTEIAEALVDTAVAAGCIVEGAGLKIIEKPNADVMSALDKAIRHVMERGRKRELTVAGLPRGSVIRTLMDGTDFTQAQYDEALALVQAEATGDE